MAVYDKKIETYQRKAQAVEERIRKSTDELKQIRSQIMILKYQSICERLNCNENELEDTFLHEHDLLERIRQQGYTEEDIEAFSQWKTQLKRISEEEENEKF